MAKEEIETIVTNNSNNKGKRINNKDKVSDNKSEISCSNNENSCSRQVVVKEQYSKISNKSLAELLELKEVAGFFIDYYENLAKANTGYYAFDSEEIYYNSKRSVEKYSKIYDRVVAEIENKINKELI